jgi:hypothetical protein
MGERGKKALDFQGPFCNEWGKAGYPQMACQAFLEHIKRLQTFSCAFFEFMGTISPSCESFACIP